MRVLVTGGAGYIGSALVSLLLTKGYRVRVLDILRRGGNGLLDSATNPNFEFVLGDICDEKTVTAALDDMDAIVHLAAVVGNPACMKEPSAATAANVDGTRLLVELRHPDQFLLFASTGSVYGTMRADACTEEMAAEPSTIYTRTKSLGERMVLAAGNAVVYRFATAFGVSPAMRLDLLPNDFVYQAVRRGSLVVYEGGFTREFIHVQDMAQSIEFALRNWQALVDDVYNIGNAKISMTKAELAYTIQRQVDYYLHFAEFGSDPDQRNYVASYDKIHEKGFTASVDLDSGIAELVRAARLLA